MSESQGNRPATYFRLGLVLMLAFALASLLAACSTTPPPASQDFVLEGEIDPTGLPLPNTISLLAAEASALAMASVFEIEEGLYSLATGVIEFDGSFSLPLPEGDEIPDALFVPAGDLFAWTGLACDLDASSSASLIDLLLIFPPLTLPILVIGQIQGGDASALLYTDADLEGPMPDQFAAQTWTYADAAVVAQGECTDPEGLDPTAVIAVIDLSLEQGWNPVVIHFDAAAELITVTEGVVTGGSWQLGGL